LGRENRPTQQNKRKEGEVKAGPKGGEKGVGEMWETGHQHCGSYGEERVSAVQKDEEREVTRRWA